MGQHITRRCSSAFTWADELQRPLKRLTVRRTEDICRRNGSCTAGLATEERRRAPHILIVIPIHPMLIYVGSRCFRAPRYERIAVAERGDVASSSQRVADMPLQTSSSPRSSDPAVPALPQWCLIGLAGGLLG